MANSNIITKEFKDQNGQPTLMIWDRAANIVGFANPTAKPPVATMACDQTSAIGQGCYDSGRSVGFGVQTVGGAMGVVLDGGFAQEVSRTRPENMCVNRLYKPAEFSNLPICRPG